MGTKKESVSPINDHPSAEALSEREGIFLLASIILLEICVRLGVGLDTVLQRFREILGSQEYQCLPLDQEAKEKLAARAVKAKIAWQAQIQAKLFEVTILGISHGNPTKNVPGKTATIIKPLENVPTEPTFRVLNFWGNNITKIDGMIKGHVYHCNLARNKSADDINAWDIIDETEFIHQGRSEDDPMDIISRIPVTPISEAGNNLSRGWSDYQRIDVDVMGHHITNEGHGMMFVIDDSSEDMIYGMNGDDVPSGGFVVFCNPADFYGDGSMVTVIGRITRRDDGRISMSADCVIPVLTVPYTTDYEDVDVDTESYDEPVVDILALDLDEDEW